MGWTSHVHRGFPGKFESTNLSLEIPSVETGRIARRRRLPIGHRRERFPPAVAFPQIPGGLSFRARELPFPTYSIVQNSIVWYSTVQYSIV